jgi:hypothetical protein
MSKEKTLFPEKIDIITKMEISKDDLIAIAVARREQELLLKKKTLNGEIKALKSNKKEAEEAFQANCVETVKDKFRANVNPIVNNLIVLGQKVKVKWTVTTSVGKPAHYHNAENDIQYVIKFEPENGGYNSRVFEIKGSFDFSEDQNEAKELIDIIDSKLKDKQAESVEVRKNLSQLATVERQAKAALAIKVLNNSDGGKELLETISSENIPLLEI